MNLVSELLVAESIESTYLPSQDAARNEAVADQLAADDQMLIRADDGSCAKQSSDVHRQLYTAARRRTRLLYTIAHTHTQTSLSLTPSYHRHA